MEFILTYKGELKSGNKSRILEHKHEIRKQFRDQLKVLWETSDVMKNYEVNGAYNELEEVPRPIYARLEKDKGMRLLYECIKEHEPFQINNFSFIPLVCKRFHLKCSLDILMMEQKSSGVINNSDIDNRLKTLFDALRMPSDQELKDARIEGKNLEPFYCLLEDDNLITSFLVKSENLLSATNQKNYVELLVRVNISPMHGTTFNLGFV